MQTFLNSVVSNFISKVDHFQDYTIILPSKRAGLFFKNEFKSVYKKPCILPKILSIEDFIQELSNLYPIDTTTLTFEFYNVYKDLLPKEEVESFESFFTWAPTLLRDFNEIDRHLIDPDYIFSYLSDIKRLDTLLGNSQKKTDLIEKQYKFYEKLPVYYNGLQQHLLKKGIAYQGLQYREAAENLYFYIEHLSNTQKILFVGFNALNKAEEYIFKELLSNSIATIYWDLDSYFYETHDNSSLFIKKYLSTWNYYAENKYENLAHNFQEKKHIHCIGTPKKIAQVKYAGKILSQLDQNKNNSTALVLADESLLGPMLNSLPHSVTSVNITMGYELKNIPVFNVFELLFKLHINSKNDRFYYKNILALFNLPHVKSLFKNEESLHKITSSITKFNYVYLQKSDLLHHADDKNLTHLSFLFDNWNNDANTALNHFLKLIELLKNKLNLDALHKEYLFHFYTIFQQLLNLNTEFNYLKDLKTLHQFYYQILRFEKLSFQGEPLTGLQIMGMLETRVLDFENVILTSVNEGILPTGKSEFSFIPYDIKKEVGLPTYLEKDAIFSYHFFRLLQRAKNIYLLYNTEPDDYGTGEQSRFITQLELYKENEINKFIVSSKLKQIQEIPKNIAKNVHLQKELIALAQKGLSPTTLTTYMLNPFEFYKQKILNINEVEEVEETIAANTLGTIIHKTLEALYAPFKGVLLTKDILIAIKSKASAEVDHWFSKEYLSKTKVTGKNLLIYNVAHQFILNFLDHELGLVKQGKKIKILELEYDLATTLHIEGIAYPVKLIGQADRIDEIDGVIRIIDYKTGKVEQRQLMINDWELITSDYDKYSKSFQVLFYALLYATMNTINLDEVRLESGIISFKNQKSGFMKVNKTQITENDISSFKEQLKKLIIEILNPNISINDNQISYSK